MESSGSCSVSTASAFPADMSLSLNMAIRDEDRNHNSQTSSRVEEMHMEGAFKCKFCPRAFKTARARGGHQKAHRQLHTPKENKKANKGGRPIWSPSRIGHCSYATALRSACLRAQPFGEWSSQYDPSVCPVPPSFPWQTGTSTGNLAAALGAGGNGDAGRLGRLQGVREVNQEEPADGIDLTLKL